MNRRTRAFGLMIAAASLFASLAAGCSEKLPDGPRVPTFPVVGQILVDGQPPNYLSVRFEPQFDKPADVPGSGAYTDQDGRFQIGTFESGDGAPPGKYKVTFLWGQINLLNGQYGGPDKLHGRYRKAAESKIEVNVTDGKIDLGTIELKTK